MEIRIATEFNTCAGILDDDPVAFHKYMPWFDSDMPPTLACNGNRYCYIVFMGVATGKHPKLQMKTNITGDLAADGFIKDAYVWVKRENQLPQLLENYDGIVVKNTHSNPVLQAREPT